MNRKDFRPFNLEEPEAIEPELRHALANFKSSVDAWSDAVMSRPRESKILTRRGSQGQAFVRGVGTNRSIIRKWALGFAVFAGTVAGAVYQNHLQVEAARALQMEAARAEAARAAQQIAEQKAKEQTGDDLMAKVDSDISREVPSALEPMASLMSEGDNSGN